MSADKLASAGYKRREQLARRLDNLNQVAEKLSEDTGIYKIDTNKLKDEPEILKHLNFNNFTFEVDNPVEGYCYLWERDNHNSIAYRKQQARSLLGAGHAGWEVVNRDMPEAPELLHVDGSRKIGDVVLMRIKRDSYELIQKRLLLMNKYREMSITGPLADFVRQHEGLVKVESWQGSNVREYFAQQGKDIQHTAGIGADEPIFRSVSDMVEVQSSEE